MSFKRSVGFDLAALTPRSSTVLKQKATSEINRVFTEAISREFRTPLAGLNPYDYISRLNHSRNANGSMIVVRRGSKVIFRYQEVNTSGLDALSWTVNYDFGENEDVATPTI